MFGGRFVQEGSWNLSRITCDFVQECRIFVGRFVQEGSWNLSRIFCDFVQDFCDKSCTTSWQTRYF